MACVRVPDAMILALLLVPALFGIASFFTPVTVGRRSLLVAGASIHLLLTGTAWFHAPEPVGGWLALDAPGLLFLSITSLLAAATSVHAAGFLSREVPGERREEESGLILVNAPEAVFTGCFLLFLASMTLVVTSRHFGLLWIAIEATTLASAPLIYFHRHRHSLEATWKYLLVCSIGIALALLGNFLLVAASSASGLAGQGLGFSDLLARATRLDPLWLKVAAIFFFVGYGTKMGLAPLHTWLPDAHSEAPSSVSALLSGALLNCAFLALLRVQALLVAAGLGDFGREILLGFGLLSLAVAAVFIIRQSDAKRLLAYSSIEHVGLLAVGAGLGGLGLFAAFFHALNHSLTKAVLFMSAGNILEAVKTKRIAAIRGLSTIVPWTAALWIAGFLSITGCPPFGTFFSKFLILKSAAESGAWTLATVVLLLLLVVFCGMAPLVLSMAQGRPPGDPARRHEPRSAVIPPLVLALLVLLLGLWMPGPLSELCREACRVVEGVSPP